MVCSKCKNGVYNHCTCYLHGVYGIDPAEGSMLASDWYDACDLSSPPAHTTNYLIATPGHVAVRIGNTYYYHPGSPGAAAKSKEHSK